MSGEVIEVHDLTHRPTDYWRSWKKTAKVIRLQVCQPNTAAPEDKVRLRLTWAQLTAWCLVTVRLYVWHSLPHLSHQHSDTWRRCIRARGRLHQSRTSHRGAGVQYLARKGGRTQSRQTNIHIQTISSSHTNTRLSSPETTSCVSTLPSQKTQPGSVAPVISRAARPTSTLRRRERTNSRPAPSIAMRLRRRWQTAPTSRTLL